MAKKTGLAQVKSGEPFGTTFQPSTTHLPATKGNYSDPKKGKIGSNGVVTHATGPTRTINSPAVNFPDKPAAEKPVKVIQATSGNGIAATATGTKTATGFPGKSSYGLSKSYSKSGSRDKTRFTN